MSRFYAFGMRSFILTIEACSERNLALGFHAYVEMSAHFMFAITSYLSFLSLREQAHSNQAKKTGRGKQGVAHCNG